MQILGECAWPKDRPYSEGLRTGRESGSNSKSKRNGRKGEHKEKLEIRKGAKKKSNKKLVMGNEKWEIRN